MDLFGRRRREEAPWWVTGIYQRLDLMLTNQENMMTQMDDLAAATARNTDAKNSILNVLQGVTQQLKDAQASNDPAAMKAVIDQLDQNSQGLAAAAVQGTKADPNPSTAAQAPPPAPDTGAAPPPASPPTPGA